jgi:hypothetical protein
MVVPQAVATQVRRIFSAGVIRLAAAPVGKRDLLPVYILPASERSRASLRAGQLNQVDCTALIAVADAEPEVERGTAIDVAV